MTPAAPRPFIAAYRFQLTPDDDFTVALRLVPYLRSLGVSHLYLSPIAEAEPGSTHGYDITDPTRVREELGGPDALDRLCAELDQHGLGLVLDIVPNHLSIATPERNPWFWDVLRQGRQSRHAAAFDIDWDAGDGAVVLPVLTQPLTEEILHIRPDRDAAEPVIVLSTGMRLPVTEPIDGLSPEAIEAVLDRQPYRLVPWQSDERNQRRFFEIDTLAGVAVEDEAVRRDRHALLAELLDRWPQVIDGVRVDHVDGLAHPDDYLVWLRGFIGDERLLLVEKILVGTEELPDRWPVDGTTGYEFARLVDRLLIDDDGLDDMRSVWAERTGDDHTYRFTEHAAIEEVLRDRLRPEVERVHRLIDDVPALAGPDGEEAIIGLTSSLGRYRTYLPHGGGADAAVIEAAAARARSTRPTLHDAFTALTAILTSPTTDAHHQAQTSFQQLTGPALAKGGEDRALYRYLPLAALNEVGGDPDTSSATVTEFHEWAAHTAAKHPRTLLTTSTHDTKRSGDVRARLLALSHRPSVWRTLVSTCEPQLPLDPADGLLLLQSAVGAWPIDEQRLADYLIKAIREGARRSSWIDPDQGYEAKVTGVVADVLADPTFVSTIERAVEIIDARAQIHSLIQTLLRLTAPGIGDLYRGDEVRDLSLVDPDNRRPLDWDELVLASVDSDQLDVPLALTISTDLAKLCLIRRTLACRRAQPSTLDYEPIHAHPAADIDDRVLAFRRGDMLVVVGLGDRLTAPPATLRLPDGDWRPVLRTSRRSISGTVAVAEIIDVDLPLALLARSR